MSRAFTVGRSGRYRYTIFYRVLAGDPRRASEEPSQDAQRLMLLD
jgi:hypothetical protein